MQLEFKDHPARRRSSVTGQYQRDEKGERIPLMPDERSIWMDGVCVAYCHKDPDTPVVFCRHIDDYEKDRVLEFAAEQRGGAASAVGMPPSPLELQAALREGDEDDDE